MLNAEKSATKGRELVITSGLTQSRERTVPLVAKARKTAKLKSADEEIVWLEAKRVELQNEPGKSSQQSYSSA